MIYVITYTQICSETPYITYAHHKYIIYYMNNKYNIT